MAGTISQCPRQDYAFAARARGAEVDLQLGWLAGNGILGEVVAMEQGYYDVWGVEQKTTPGGSGVDGVASVAAGRHRSTFVEPVIDAGPLGRCSGQERSRDRR